MWQNVVSRKDVSPKCYFQAFSCSFDTDIHAKLSWKRALQYLQDRSFQTPLVAKWNHFVQVSKSSFHKIKRWLLVAVDDIMIRQNVSFGNILVFSLGLNEHYIVSYKACIVYRQKNVPWIEWSKTVQIALSIVARRCQIVRNIMDHW